MIFTDATTQTQKTSADVDLTITTVVILIQFHQRIERHLSTRLKCCNILKIRLDDFVDENCKFTIYFVTSTFKTWCRYSRKRVTFCQTSVKFSRGNPAAGRYTIQKVRVEGAAVYGLGGIWVSPEEARLAFCLPRGEGVGGWLFAETTEGPFSAVSKPIFATQSPPHPAEKKTCIILKKLQN